MHLNGVRFVLSPMALQHHKVFDIVCNPRRRRRRYSVKKREWTTPGCYLLHDGTIVMHPDLYEQLKKQRGK